MKHQPRETNEEPIKINEVTNPKELEILKGQKATFENLVFQFTDQYISDLQKDLERPLTKQLLLFAGEKFAGYIAAYQDQKWPKSIYIKELFINPEFQGQGLGKQLVNNIFDFAATQNMPSIVTQTESENTAAQTFYESLGFKKIENPEWPLGITYRATTST